MTPCNWPAPHRHRSSQGRYRAAAPALFGQLPGGEKKSLIPRSSAAQATRRVPATYCASHHPANEGLARRDERSQPRSNAPTLTTPDPQPRAPNPRCDPPPPANATLGTDICPPRHVLRRPTAAPRAPPERPPRREGPVARERPFQLQERPPGVPDPFTAAAAPVHVAQEERVGEPPTREPHHGGPEDRGEEDGEDVRHSAGDARDED